jgi:hypothetical protein
MSGGGTETQTTQASSEPWKHSQPILKASMKHAGKLYEQGIGGQPYTGSTVVPYADQSLQAFDHMENTANQAMGAGNPFQQAFQGIGDIAGGGMNAAQSQALGNMSQTASGDDVFGANPQFQNILGQVQEDVRDNVNMSASGMGRYGSGIHQGTLGDSIGDVTARMYSDEYNRQLGRKDAATQNLFNAGQMGMGNMMQASSMLPSVYQGQMAPAQTLAGVGQQYEDLAGRTLNDRLRIFDETQEAPWKQIMRMNAVASGAGQYGTNTSTAQMPGGSGLGGVAGGALAGNSLFPGGLGAIGGGLLGAFM